MFHDTMTFRADYGTNLAIEGANAERAYMRAFHDAPNPRRQVAALSPLAMSRDTAAIVHPLAPSLVAMPGIDGCV